MLRYLWQLCLECEKKARVLPVVVLKICREGTQTFSCISQMN